MRRFFGALRNSGMRLGCFSSRGFASAYSPVGSSDIFFVVAMGVFENVERIIDELRITGFFEGFLSGKLIYAI